MGLVAAWNSGLCCLLVAGLTYQIFGGTFYRPRSQTTRRNSAENFSNHVSVKTSEPIMCFYEVSYSQITSSEGWTTRDEHECP